jgi:hypothetical protein
MAKLLGAFDELKCWNVHEFCIGDDPPGWERRYTAQEPQKNYTARRRNKMRLDELLDLVAQPQQDKIVKLEVEGKLVDFEVSNAHDSGFFVFTPKALV